MKKSIFLFCMCILVQYGSAQKSNPLVNVAIKWEMLENNFKQGNFGAVLTIENKGSSPIDLRPWNLYFSYPREIQQVQSNNALFTHQGGEFYEMKLVDEVALQAKAKLAISYIAKGKSMNITDAPSGFYWAAKNGDKIFHAIKNIQISAVPLNDSRLVNASAATLFEKNANAVLLPINQVPKILPKPVSYKESTGVFKLNVHTQLVFDQAFLKEAELFNAEMFGLLGAKLKVSPKPLGKAIVFKHVAGLEKEAYHLTVTSTLVEISASDAAGAFYGIQSLKMLMPPMSWAKKQVEIVIAAARVSDYPRFSYRSFMLDVARNFQSKTQILKLLDLLSLYKINTFHFHLNDDEGWRLEIKDLPELTVVGGRRGHTLDEANYLKPAYGSGPDTVVTPGSGYYTAQDFVEILTYAKNRHITVIPELETPGHARAAIKAMDNRYHRLMKEGKAVEATQFLLRDTLDQSLYKSVQGYHDNVMNIALPSTYRFIEKVVDELAALYQQAGAPFNTVHLGGDEVPKGVWEKSPAIVSLMQQEKITNYDDLWYFYIGKVNRLLKIKNLYLSGWEEVAMRKVNTTGDKFAYIANPDFVDQDFRVYVWNNVWGGGSEDLAYRLANAGYKVVLSAVTNYYFDLAYQNEVGEPGLYWGSFVDTDKAFYFSPYNYYRTAKEGVDGKPLNPAIFKGKERLTELGKQNIMGIQSHLWSEKVNSSEAMEYMLLPKLLGYAERAWSKEPDWSLEADSAKSWSHYLQDWSNFANLLGQRELTRLSYYAGGYKFRVPPPGAIVSNGQLKVNTQFPGLTVKYTTDGSEPTKASKTYTGAISRATEIKLKVFAGDSWSKTLSIKTP